VTFKELGQCQKRWRRVFFSFSKNKKGKRIRYN
jgi:hypothetical protein